MQVLPLSLSVGFLRLVLAVVDDHARSQGQVKTKVDTVAGAGADAVPPGTAAAAVAKCQKVAVGAALGEEEDVGAPVVHATAICFLSVGDLPRLYGRPGAIVRNLFKACKGEKPSGEVK